jgi:hypothetical protein
MNKLTARISRYMTKHRVQIHANMTKTAAKESRPKSRTRNPVPRAANIPVRTVRGRRRRAITLDLEAGMKKLAEVRSASRVPWRNMGQ